MYLTHRPSARRASIAVLVLLLAACSSDAERPTTGSAPTTPPPGSGRLPVVLDFSPTLSDATALLYLAVHPSVELLAVTLPGTGEAACEPGTRTTRALLTIAGQIDVPVGCGRDAPLAGDRDWPAEWRAEVDSWGDELLPAVAPAAVVDAEVLLADVLAGATEPVTIVAVGPLTNLAAVFDARPELRAHVARIVVMGGAVDVPGNVEASPTAEWNIYIDPTAAQRTIETGIPVLFVPLDATNSVPWTERLLARLGSLAGAAARTVHDLAGSRASLEGFYLWDELAAMAAVRPDLVTVEQLAVAVLDDGSIVRDGDGTPVSVAVAADAGAATDELLRTLNGGTLDPVVPLTDDEREHLTAMGGADSRFGAAFGQAFAALDDPDADARTAVAAFLDVYYGAIAELAGELSALSPPPSLAAQHAAYVAAIRTVLATQDGVRRRVATASPTASVDELFGALGEDLSDGLLRRVDETCQVLVDFSFVHDGPRPCSTSGDG